MELPDKQREKQMKVFAYGLPLILAVMGVRHGFKHGWNTFAYAFLILAFILLLVSIFCRPLMNKIFHYWMIVAHAIGTVITGAILVFVYYVVFTPVSLVLKLTGKDFMARSLKKELNSYWIVRQGNRQDDAQKYTQQG